MALSVELPAHVWYVHDQSMTSPQPPLLGLLLEWRQVVDRRGVRKWKGLVGFARHGGFEMTWVRAAMLQPCELATGVTSRVLAS